MKKAKTAQNPKIRDLLTPHQIEAFEFARKAPLENPREIELLYLLSLKTADETAVTEITLPDPLRLAYVSMMPVALTDPSMGLDDTTDDPEGELALEALVLSYDPCHGRQQLADSLGVDIRSVDRWKKEGLPCFQIGKNTFYLESEVHAWLRKKGHRVLSDGTLRLKVGESGSRRTRP